MEYPVENIGKMKIDSHEMGFDSLWRYIKSHHTFVNIGLGNGLLLDSTKPLPDPILTYHYFKFCFLNA